MLNSFGNIKIVDLDRIRGRHAFTLLFPLTLARYTHVSLSLSSMSYEEEDTCMSYEEEDTACHMRRRIHACNASGCSRTPTALSVRLESCERR